MKTLFAFLLAFPAMLLEIMGWLPKQSKNVHEQFGKEDEKWKRL